MTAPQPAPGISEARAALLESQRLMSEMRELRRLSLERIHEVRHSAALLAATMEATMNGAAIPRPAPAAPPVPLPSPPATRRLDSQDEEKLNLLTSREIEVLKLIAEGQRTKEIAFQLGITFKTAVTHRSNIMEKLGIHEGPRLVRFAIRTGICKA
jgi:DNA-binding NarL/FixJ family response regulator